MTLPAERLPPVEFSLSLKDKAAKGQAITDQERAVIMAALPVDFHRLVTEYGLAPVLSCTMEFTNANACEARVRQRLGLMQLPPPARPSKPVVVVVKKKRGREPWSPEQRAAASARMRARHAANKSAAQGT